jgi:DNA gyrase subunit A
MEGGKVVRSNVDGVPAKGRDTMGVVFARPDEGDKILAIARNSERNLDSSSDEDDADVPEGDAAITETEAPAND